MRQIAAKFVPCLFSVDFLCRRACKIRPKRIFLSAVTGNEDGNNTVESMMI